MKRRRISAAVLVAVVVVGLALFVGDAPPQGVGAWMGPAAVSPRFEIVEGVRIRYVRRGRGPAVVLVHGFASSIYTWKDVIPALAESHDVVALDLPAHGGSEVPARLDFATLPGVVVGLLDRLGIARASLVGHSLGGAVVTTVAARHPERVDRLVLIDSAGYNLSPEDRPWLLRFVAAAPLGPALDRLPLRRRLARLGLEQVFHDDTEVTAERVDEYLAPLARPGSVPALRSLLMSRDAKESGFPEIIGQVRVPTLVIWGRQDTWVPVAHADRFEAAIPHAKKVVLEGCGHMPQEEKPERTIDLLREFLGSPLPPGGG